MMTIEEKDAELKAAPKKKWQGSTPVCDFCGEWTAGSVFVDGKTKMGPWALMCATHYLRLGVGIGPGLGQVYSADTKEKIGG